jgi:hypothetical protein
MLELVIIKVGLDYISRLTIRVQKYRCHFMGPYTTVQQFVERLNECPTALTHDEIIDILDQAKPPNWHEAIILANIDIFEMDYELFAWRI